MAAGMRGIGTAGIRPADIGAGDGAAGIAVAGTAATAEVYANGTRRMPWCPCWTSRKARELRAGL
jgi:hypothetical protein